MTTTLIVRDAILVVNGAPEKRREPREHLERRISEVRELDLGLVEECVEVLLPAAAGEGADPEVLEAVVVVGLAHPDLAARAGIAPGSVGRRLASRLERMGQTERALAVLETLALGLPGDAAVDRDLAALMRRQGMVRDLADRYLARAQSLIREGREGEAVGWLKEILQLDRNRSDVARLIRDLRLHREQSNRMRPVRWRFVLGALVASALGSFTVMREVELRRAYDALPQAAEGQEDSVAARLAAVEAFIEEHPLWHGAFHALRERSELRVERKRLEAIRREALETARQKHDERLLEAEAARLRGVQKVADGDLSGAVLDFEEALEKGGKDWSERGQVERDLASVHRALAEGRSKGGEAP